MSEYDIDSVLSNEVSYEDYVAKKTACIVSDEPILESDGNIIIGSNGGGELFGLNRDGK